MQADILQGVAYRWIFKLYLNDHVTPATLKTVAITISKNGAAFANPSAGAANATETGQGWYYYDFSTTDCGTLGPMVGLGTCSGCDNADQAYQIVPATNRGMTALPTTPLTTNGSLITSGTGTDQLKVTGGGASINWAAIVNPTATVALTNTTIAASAGGVNVTQWNGQNVAVPNVAGVPIVDTAYLRGSLSQGSAGYAGIDWGQIHNASATQSLFGTTINTCSAGVVVSTNNDKTGYSIALGQAVPTTGNINNSIADCLNAARAQGFGSWNKSGTTLTLYAPDGSTVVRTFTLDDATAPSIRT
jgi:hypothetical protein